MQALRLLFSPAGRLPPKPFILAAVAVYLVGAASHLLTLPEFIARNGLWLFLGAQVLLVWIWFAVHAKRLRDAGRTVGLAAGVAILYALSVALLIILAVSFYSPLADQAPDANTASALGLILLLSIIAILLGAPHYDLAWLMVAALMIITLVPPVLAAILTIWAATRPSRQVPGA
jgi:uncharacterized membrane protein YhaH (DUF805 family)